jgi:hypothetical protein
LRISLAVVNGELFEADDPGGEPVGEGVELGVGVLTG